jgi:predicted phage terminase large subunit-like protein
LRADKDKYSRALPIAAMLESGKVFFLRNAYWLSEFEAELLAFPNGKNDDQVDAFAYIPTLCPARGNTFLAGQKLRTSVFSDF